MDSELSGDEPVVVVEAAEDRAGDPACSRRQLVACGMRRHRQAVWWIRQPRPEARVGPAAVVVVHPLAEDQPEVALVERDEPVEAPAAQGPDESLAVRVRPGRPDGGSQDAQPEGAGGGVGLEDGVAVVQEEAVAVIARDRLSKLLSDPG